MSGAAPITPPTIKESLTFYNALVKQQSYYRSGATLPIDFRISQLKKLRKAIEENETLIMEALSADLRKPAFEAFGTEIGILYAELDEHLKNLKSWSKPTTVRTGFFHFKAYSKIYNDPRGAVLIIAPWNYPFHLALLPLIGAISAGNVAAIKPSELAPAVSGVIAKIIGTLFSPEYISVWEGGVDTATGLLQQKWDLIFFTGSTSVGQKVYEAAAKNLTPVVLELGGKSPCIVHSDAQLENAAKRIAWGKVVNAGQTCVAPDYLYIHESVKEPFLERLRQCFTDMLGEIPENSPDYARIINEQHFDRLLSLMKNGTLYSGGISDRTTRYISPTILTDMKEEYDIMREEIFGPLLPVITYTDIKEVIGYINAHPKPLALYIFTTSDKIADKVIHYTSSGGGCVNDVMWHLGNKHLPLGGVGDSGMGVYHGRSSFDAFSHKKSFLHRSASVDLPLRYPPYNKVSLPTLKKLFKYFG